MKIRILTNLFLLLLITNVYSISQKDKIAVDERNKDFKARISKEHPRVQILKSELDKFRDFFRKMNDDKNYSYIFKNAILNKFDIAFFPEPVRLPEKKNSAEVTKIWQDGYNNAFKTASTAEHYAFSYMITGDKKYASEAVRWLKYLCGWDLNGGIDIKNNDEAFIQSLRPMILAYDWVYDALSPNDKKTIEYNLNTRLSILFDHVTKVYSATESIPIEKNDSHKMRFISTIGLGGLSLYHELKDAPLWLAWAYEYYNRLFPAWGGDDGGYSEGLDYWRTGHNQHFMFLDAMKTLGLNEVFNRNYFKNNGYYAIYNVMPYPYSSFGDLCNTQTPNENTAMHIEKYSLYYNDPYLMKFWEIIFEKYPSRIEYYNYSFFDSIFQLYRKGSVKIETKDLKDLPRSRYFSDIGWVAMHSDLGNKYGDIMLGFKSSPFGSASHSFADQNSFVINAFGEQLAISSGYREWYGSPHHYGYAKATMSKNAVLFDNKGQVINSANAEGKIIYFYTGKNIDYTAGDAANAFDQFTGVVKNLRSILFVNKKYFIVFDELENKKAVTNQWLLHSKTEMSFNAINNDVEVTKNNANLLVKFILPEKNDLKFTKTDEFAVPIDKAYTSKYKKDWHFTANAFKASAKREFISFLYPYKKDFKENFSIENLKTFKGFILFCRTGDDNDIIFLSKENERIAENDINFLKGRAAVISKKTAKTNFSMIDGTELRSGDLNILSSGLINIEGQLEESKAELNINSSGKAEIKIKILFEPKDIEGISREKFKYDSKNKTAEIIVDRDSVIKLKK